MKSLQEYQKLVDATPCPNCGGPLGKIEMYTHSGGWLVQGYEERQWLSARCLSGKCHGYDWSLWKLGILGSVEHPE